MSGAEFFKSHECDSIIALGGGSPMDCAKAIGVVCSNEMHVLKFEGVDNVPHPGPPLICVPTTAGSAADVSQFSIITDTSRRLKIAIVSHTMVPDASLIDPLLTVSMEPKLTAYTGLDALTHACEAYASNASSAVTDLHALEAVRLVGKHLLNAIHSPQDTDARTGMMLASTHAGLAFSNAILGAVHAMAHSLGGLLDLPHGMCNAILLDHVVAYNFNSAPDKYRDLANALGANISNVVPIDECKEQVVDVFRKLKQAAGVNETLGLLGVKAELLPQLAKNALNDPCMLTNPTQPSLEDVIELYEQAC